MANRLISVGDTSYLPASIRVDEVNLPTGVKSAVVAGKVGKGDLMVNVLDYLAVADATDAGGTDNTAAFQAAMDAAWNGGKGGTLLIPPGAYHLFGYVILRSNVRIIGYGATIRKYGLSGSTYITFHAISGGPKGYGSSARNVTFEGLTFRGRFVGAGSGNGVSVTLHHAQDVTFRKCTWTETVISGHAIDLMGCNGVLVDDCSFSGFNPATNREYVEAIQIDYSMADGGGYDAPASFDGLPTINVTVQNSKFLPQTVGVTPYPAPNPLGSHSRVDGSWFDNIKFLNNYVEGGADTSTITDGFAVLTRGWIHFFCARNIEIRGNRFVNASGRAVRVIGAYPISTGTSMANVAVAGAASVSMTPMPIMNILIENNTFEGFTNDADESLINLRGTTSQNGRNVRISGNTLKDSFSTPGVSGDKGADFAYIQDVNGLTMADNYLNVARSLLYAFRVNKINVRGGQLINLGAYIARFSTCTDISVSGVHVDGHGGGYYFYNSCVGIDVSGGSILNGRADAIRQKHFSISAATEWSIRSIRIPKDANGYTAAIDAYAASTKGVVSGVFASGWDAGTFLSLGSGSTAANYDRNVY